jgi:hypothetical protein
VNYIFQVPLASCQVLPTGATGRRTRKREREREKEIVPLLALQKFWRSVLRTEMILNHSSWAAQVRQQLFDTPRVDCKMSQQSRRCNSIGFTLACWWLLTSSTLSSSLYLFQAFQFALPVLLTNLQWIPYILLLLYEIPGMFSFSLAKLRLKELQN